MEVEQSVTIIYSSLNYYELQFESFNNTQGQTNMCDKIQIFDSEYHRTQLSDIEIWTDWCWLDRLMLPCPGGAGARLISWCCPDGGCWCSPDVDGSLFPVVCDASVESWYSHGTYIFFPHSGQMISFSAVRKPLPTSETLQR